MKELKSLKKYSFKIIRIMKKLFVALMCIGCLASCTLFDAMKYSEEIYDGADPSYDKYPGMNANTDPLTGTAFYWPEAFKINSVIMGEQNQRDEEDQSEDLVISKNMYGSGLCVIVTLDITNVTSSKQTLVLPRGLLIEAASSAYQNGILVKDVKIPFKANEQRKVSVRFYCLNSSAHASDGEAVYGIGYVTNIAAFQPLFNVCEGKKLNIDQYSTLSILSYYSACTVVQEIVWAITQGKTFTEKEIKKYLKHVKRG